MQNNTFTSNFTVKNVTEQHTQAVIQCVIVENGHSGYISIIESYLLNIYHQPQTRQCSATIDYVIAINCEVSDTYTELFCRMFPKYNSTTVAEEGMWITEAEPLIVEGVPFKASNVTKCSWKYSPQKSGVYRFQIEVFDNKNLVNLFSTTTNNVTVTGPAVMAVVMAQGDNNSQETATAFQVLLSSVAILATAILVFISWAIWARRTRCCYSSRAGYQSNVYESIQSAGQILPSQNDLGMHENLQTSDHMLSRTVPRPHVRLTPRNIPRDEYIVPNSPSLTYIRSAQTSNVVYLSVDDNYNDHESVSTDDDYNDRESMSTGNNYNDSESMPTDDNDHESVSSFISENNEDSIYSQVTCSDNQEP